MHGEDRLSMSNLRKGKGYHVPQKGIKQVGVYILPTCFYLSECM
jgi:hypothetical protein